MNDIGPQSPCISICVLDDNDICQGCFRSAREITEWFMESPKGKQDILERAIARRKDSFPVKLL